MEFYAAPVDRVSGPFGWPSYVAKQPWGIVPVEEDGRELLRPGRQTLYFQALDGDLSEVQRMRSVVQLQPGETRSCIGCHEDRRCPAARAPAALAARSKRLEPRPGAPAAGLPAGRAAGVGPQVRPMSQCGDKQKIDLTARWTPTASRLVQDLIQQAGSRVGLRLNSGGNEKREPKLRHVPSKL